MSALQAYLKLRRRLLGRQLREVGVVRLVMLVPVLVILVSRGIMLAAGSTKGQWAVPVVLALGLASAHRQRADLRFLATSAPGFQRWVAIEYALWALHVALVLALFRDWGAAGLAMVLAPLAAFVPVAREGRSTRNRVSTPFRSEAFEWVSSMRTGTGWAWLAALVGALWQPDAPIGPLLALAGWLLVLTASYGLPEPVTMLAVAARGVGPFLRRRLLLGLGYAGLTAAPFLWLLARSAAGVGGAAVVGTAWLALFGLIILTKYAFYPNALHIRTTQALVVGVALALPGNPVYPVLMLVAVGGLIWQSQRRLRAVLGNGSVCSGSPAAAVLYHYLCLK
ncbi:MAG: hypothetical protein JWR44_1903 [Hymenobacter sp.]|jgi:hypothetical protein|nr:hypothetical protein [Hymenobacter sp.]